MEGRRQQVTGTQTPGVSAFVKCISEPVNTTDFFPGRCWTDVAQARLHMKGLVEIFGAFLFILRVYSAEIRLSIEKPPNPVSNRSCRKNEGWQNIIISIGVQPAPWGSPSSCCESATGCLTAILGPTAWFDVSPERLELLELDPPLASCWSSADVVAPTKSFPARSCST